MNATSTLWLTIALTATLWGCGSPPETYLCTFEVRGQEDGEDVTANVDYEVCSSEDLTGSGVAAANTLLAAVDCNSIEGFEDLEGLACDPMSCVPLGGECDNHAEATRVEE